VAGKGDTPRPRQISDEEWEKNYRRIFGRTKPKRTEPDPAEKARRIGQRELFE